MATKSQSQIGQLIRSANSDLELDLAMRERIRSANE